MSNMIKERMFYWMCKLYDIVSPEDCMFMVSGSVYSDISGSIPPHPRRFVNKFFSSLVSDFS